MSELVPFVLPATLALLLGAAVGVDARSHRIPNFIVAAGIAVALLLHGVGAALDLQGGALLASGQGFGGAALGLLVGCLAMLPWYLAGSAGAGDVKLLAMVGAFVGPADAVGVIVCTFVCGGAMAVMQAQRAYRLELMVRNLGRSVASVTPLGWAGVPAFDVRTQTAVRIPYSVAIAAGTWVWIASKAAH